jgi:hypothetical protein
MEESRGQGREKETEINVVRPAIIWVSKGDCAEQVGWSMSRGLECPVCKQVYE